MGTYRRLGQETGVRCKNSEELMGTCDNGVHSHHDGVKVVNWVVTNDTGGWLFLSRKGKAVKRTEIVLKRGDF